MPQTAIICGSTTAVGGALAVRLAGAGIAVVAVDEEGETAAPGAALALAIDVADEAGWAGVARELAARGMRPSMLAYALYEPGESAPLGELDAAAWDGVMMRNLRGAFLATRHLLPQVGSPGAVVLLASVLASWDSRADMVALGASSGGALALANSLALTAAPLGVRVNTVCAPAPLPAGGAARQRAVGRIPLGRATEAGDIADAMMFLLSDDARHLTGSSLVVDGGQSLQSWSNAPDESY